MWNKSKDEKAPFVPLEDEAALTAWFERDGANLLLLHDPYCPISAQAHRQASRIANPIGIVNVAAAPALSAAIETRTGIRHESPQIILLQDGDATWSASHFQITPSRIEKALAALAGAQVKTEPDEL